MDEEQQSSRVTVGDGTEHDDGAASADFAPRAGDRRGENAGPMLDVGPVEGVAVADDAPGDDAAAGVSTPDAPGVGGARPYVRRGLVAVVVTVAVALAVGAFATVGPSTAKVDQRFVEAVRTQGHVVAPGQQEVLLVTAARKICDRRENHASVEARRQTALSVDEIAVVGQTFGGDTGGFTSLALETYCPR